METVIMRPNVYIINKNIMMRVGFNITEKQAKKILKKYSGDCGEVDQGLEVLVDVVESLLDRYVSDSKLHLSPKATKEA